MDRAEDLDLFDYALIREYVGFFLVRAPRRHKRLAVLSFLAVLAVAVTALRVMPKQWEVQGVLLAQQNPLSPAKERVALTAPRELVLRRDNIEQLVKQTDFVARHLASRAPLARARDWIFRQLRGRELTSKELEEGFADGIENRLWVGVSQEGAITIGFTWSNPELALDLVQAAMTNFVDARQATEVASIGESIGILEAHLASAHRDVAEKVQRVAEQERRQRASDAPRRPLALRGPLDDETMKLEAHYASKKRALGILEDYREKRLAELRGELLQEQNVYAPGHPLVVATKRNIDVLAAGSPELDAMRSEVAKIEKDLRARRGHAGEAPGPLQDELSGARLRLEADPPQLEQQRMDLTLAFRRYSSLLAEISEAQVAQDAARTGFKYRYSVIMPPQLPRAPMKPNAPKILVMAIIAGICFALFAAAAADLMSGVVLERWQVEGRLRLPVLAESRDRGRGSPAVPDRSSD